jgi:mannose-6-phosphate isomerase-like protein (cupin superfamily)
VDDPPALESADTPAFATQRLPSDPTATAPDGSEVRVLLRLPGASMAHFELAAGRVSRAVTHRTVREIWYVLSGHGWMWRRQGEREETVELEPGLCLTIPRGTHFQFRAAESGPLRVVGVTLPPWPGNDEAERVAGPWSSDDVA